MTRHALVIALALGLGCAPKAAPAEVASAPPSAIAIGARAPDGQLTQASGTKIALADVLRLHARNVVVFYRGFY